MSSSVDVRDIEWAGDAPIFLVHRRWKRWRRKESFFKDDGQPYKKWVMKRALRPNIIDINAEGWTESPLFRFGGVMLMCAKERIPTSGIRLPLASIAIHPGEEAFCYRHVVSLVYISNSGPQQEIPTYVLGKRGPRGETGIAVLPNGMVVPLSDVDRIGDVINKGYL